MDVFRRSQRSAYTQFYLYLLFLNIRKDVTDMWAVISTRLHCYGNKGVNKNQNKKTDKIIQKFIYNQNVNK